MAKSKTFTASGVIKAGQGEIYQVNVTKVATGIGVVQVYDNPSAASGTLLFDGDGLTEQSFPLHDGGGNGSIAAVGLYLSLGGTTNASVTVVYD